MISLNVLFFICFILHQCYCFDYNYWDVDFDKNKNCNPENDRVTNALIKESKCAVKSQGISRKSKRVSNLS